ncbi:MAG: AbrB/MazE/SpoVT family DNA-binding domain-containing protein [Methanosphaera sp.]|nr:AbrB/MazE/SpoVT family DNA-binding domain-containing protein [Methanosphaera sp.]
MIVETKVYQKNKTTIPDVYCKKYNVEPEDIVEWEENEYGQLYVRFRKKITLNEMIGAGKKE